MSDKATPKTDEKEPKTAAKQPENATKQPETATKQPETATKKEVVKVKFHRTHPAFAISIGEETEISQDDFDKYDQEESFFKRIPTR